MPLVHEMPRETIHELLAAASARSAALHAQSRVLIARAEEVLSMRGAARPGKIAALIEEVAGLRRATESRAVIEQAKGMIMMASHCDADHAFALLVSQSQHQNRKVRELAEELVALKSRPRPAPVK
jgi:hypothetical protein